MPGTAASIFDAEALRQCQVQRFLAVFSDFLSKMVHIEVILVKCTYKDRHGTSWNSQSQFVMGYVQHVQLWHGTSTSDRDGPFFVIFLYGATLSPLLFNRARTDP